MADGQGRGLYEVALFESVFNALKEICENRDNTEPPDGPNMDGWTHAQLDELLTELGLSTSGIISAKQNRIAGYYSDQPSPLENAMAVGVLVIGADGNGERMTIADAKAQVGV